MLSGGRPLQPGQCFRQGIVLEKNGVRMCTQGELGKFKG